MDRGLNLADGDAWHYYLPYANATHNNKPSRRTKFTPAEIFLGKNRTLTIDFQLSPDVNFRKKEGRMYKGYVKNMMRINNTLARQNLVHYDQTRKKNYDKHRLDADNYNLNDLVLYYKGRHPPLGGGLQCRWRGPYQIIQKYNNG